MPRSLALRASARAGRRRRAPRERARRSARPPGLERRGVRRARRRSRAPAEASRRSRELVIREGARARHHGGGSRQAADCRHRSAKSAWRSRVSGRPEGRPPELTGTHAVERELGTTAGRRRRTPVGACRRRAGTQRATTPPARPGRSRAPPALDRDELDDPSVVAGPSGSLDSGSSSGCGASPFA